MRKAWKNVLQTLKPQIQAQITVPSSINHHRYKKQNTPLKKNNKFKQYLSTKSPLQKGLEGNFQPKDLNYTHQTQETNNITLLKPKERKVPFPTHAYSTTTTTNNKVTGIKIIGDYYLSIINGLNSSIKKYRLT